MKRLLILLTVLMLLFSVAACHTAPVAETTLAPQEDTTSATFPESTPPAVSVKQRPMYAISLPVTTESEITQDGTTVFLYNYQTPSLVGPEPNAADKIIVDFLNKVDATSDDAQSLRQNALNVHSSGKQWSQPYSCSIIFQPERIDSSVLSLSATYYTYADNLRPEVSYYSVNYDILTGNQLNLTDILFDDKAINTTCQMLTAILEENADQHQLYEGFQKTVEDRLLKDTDYDKSWHLDADGLTFYFSPYEIAPYTAGVIYTTIPYDSLTGILDDAYFPPEYDKDTGTVYARIFNESTATEFSQFSEIIMQSDEKKYLIYTDSSVSDVRLYSGSFLGENDTIECNIFASCGLTPGDAILLQGDIDQHPVMITYRSNGETLTGYLYNDKVSSDIKIGSIADYQASVN